MRPVTLNLNGIQDPQVSAALAEIQRASQDTLQNDTSSSGSAMATLTGAAADEVTYFTSQYTTAFTSLTAYGRSLIGAVSAAASLALLGFSAFGETLIGLAGPAIPVAQGGTGDTGTAWTAYTPVITAGAGAFTTVSAAGRFKQIGKTVFVCIDITVTTNGTAASFVVATLPALNNSSLQSLIAGREAGVTGKMLQGIIPISSSTVTIVNYDNSYPGANGALLTVNGSYESI